MLKFSSFKGSREATNYLKFPTGRANGILSNKQSFHQKFHSEGWKEPGEPPPFPKPTLREKKNKDF